MNKKMMVATFLALPAAVLVLASMNPATAAHRRIARGEYLAVTSGCNDCHTPLKFSDQGPVPDMSRMLSGHPEGTVLPPPDLKPGPWFATTAGMTAWAGPWGISYAVNLTPDKNTGLGIWTEEMFIQAMKTGKHMGAGRPILPPMPWQNFSKMTDEDLRCLYAYLRSIPAISNRVPEPTPPGVPVSFE